MTASIRARVSSFTNGDWLMTRETVFFDTPARRAMSFMVARWPVATVPLPDDLTLTMRISSDLPRLRKGEQSTRAPGVDKRSAAPLNDTGVSRHLSIYSASRPARCGRPAPCLRARDAAPGHRAFWTGRLSPGSPGVVRGQAVSRRSAVEHL